MNTVIILTFALAAPPAEPPKGILVAVGGGKTSTTLIQKLLKLADGTDPRVLIIPQASELADTGESSAQLWRTAGAKSISVLTIDDQSVKTINEANLIWMAGGDQNRLMKALPAAAVDAIRARYQAGAVVGGTSAGAAVLSTIMLTGEANLKAIKQGSTKSAPGLALWPDGIVDQHFIARQRFNRLLSAVLDHPELVGIGVDESTAAIRRGSTIEVAGDGQVMIIDARKTEKPIETDPRSARGLKLHLLSSGMKFEMLEK